MMIDQSNLFQRETIPVKEIVASVLRSNGGAHQRHIPCAAGYVTPVAKKRHFFLFKIDFSEEFLLLRQVPVVSEESSRIRNEF